MPSYKTLFKDIPWLPKNDGGTVAPSDILHIPGLEADIAPLVAASEGIFADIGMLTSDTVHHDAFKFVIEESIPKAADVLDVLGDLVKDQPSLGSYRIGTIHLPSSQFNDFCEFLQGISPDLTRGAALLSRTASVVGQELCLAHLLPGLAQGISADRMVDILEFLANKHERLPVARKSAALHVHLLYLKALVVEQARATLPKLRLLNATGKWRTVHELCPPSTIGIDEAYVINLQQFNALAQLLPNIEQVADETLDVDIDHVTPGVEQLPDESAGHLREYFKQWEAHCPRSVIAGFLSILGDGSARQLAESYFDNRGIVDATRSRLVWKAYQGITTHNGWGKSDSPLAVMATQRIPVTIFDPALKRGITVFNLLGNTSLVPPSQHFDHLLVGRLPSHVLLNTPITTTRTIAITLRVIDLARFSERELSELLRETARHILNNVYMQDVPNLDEIWEGLHEGEQKDIRIAQTRVTESLFLYVRQFGIHGYPTITAGPTMTGTEPNGDLPRLKISRDRGG